MMTDEKPLFKLRNVDVISIDPPNKSMALLIHVICSEYEIKSEETLEKINDSVKWAVEYLYQEGFIAMISGWHIDVGVHGHIPTEE